MCIEKKRIHYKILPLSISRTCLCSSVSILIDGKCSCQALYLLVTYIRSSFLELRRTQKRGKKRNCGDQIRTQVTRCLQKTMTKQVCHYFLCNKINKIKNHQTICSLIGNGCLLLIIRLKYIIMLAIRFSHMIATLYLGGPQ